MRKKEEILKELESEMADGEDKRIHAVLEVFIDIRDALWALNNKIPVVSRPGTPGSPPPPEVG